VSVGGASASTVREATFAVLRERGLTTIFSNPGSTEVPFLADLPDDIDFVLALHEGSVVGIATGCALATERPTLALLHTTAGLGNAVGAIATARVNRAPVVVLVGQQDRRHLALEPFLAGRLTGLAGDYPLEVIEPACAGDVPSAVARAAYRAEVDRGPVVVVVPMDDWDAPAAPDLRAAPARLSAARRAVPDGIAEVTSLLDRARRPALVAGALVDTPDGWAAVADLVGRRGVTVYAEPFGARAGFDQRHPAYAGQLPADRTRLRAALGRHDLVLVVGTGALRQYPFEAGPLVPEGTTLVVLTSDPDEATRSPAEVSLLGDEVETLRALTGSSREEDVRHPEEGLSADARGPIATPAAGDDAPTGPPSGDEPAPPLRPEDVFAVLADNLPAETVLVEETPSSRPALQAMVPARRPLGFLSAAMGGLGFAMPAAIGVRMGSPDRPVIAVVGDGSSMYAIQSLWTAAHRGVGVLFIVLANGRYAVMDRLADRRGGKPPWPAFPEVSVSALAAGLGVDSLTITSRDDLQSTLPGLCRDLGYRREPLLVEIPVAPGETFTP
jgi:benzoylformate decarboxylase